MVALAILAAVTARSAICAVPMAASAMFASVIVASAIFAAVMLASAICASVIAASAMHAAVMVAPRDFAPAVMVASAICAGGDLRVADVRRLDGGLRDQRRGDSRRLDVRRLDRRHLDLQGADRAVLQRPDAYGVDRQLGAGNNAAGKLARGDGVPLQRIGHRAQRHGGVSTLQAVVGILRHAHGHLYADAWCDDAHAVAEENILQGFVRLILHRFRAVDKVYLERHRGQVATLVVFRLRSVAHLSIALGLCFSSRLPR